MATYSPAQFAAKLLELNLGVGRIPLEGVTAGAQLVKTSILQLAPAVLSGKNNAKLGVAVKISGYTSSGSQATISATGPFQLIERDTKAHGEPREQFEGGPRRYIVQSEGVFSHVEHPGTRGKHPFELGVDRALPAVHRYFDVTTQSVIQAII